MVDYSKFINKDEEGNSISEIDKPRIIFLIIALLSIAGAAATYIFEETIIAMSFGESTTGFLMLLIGLVLLSMAMVLCYRVPRIGNRLLGYGALEGERKKALDGYHMSGGFKSETGAEEKHRSTKRIKARSQRRKYAKATRDMQSAKEMDAPESNE